MASYIALLRKDPDSDFGVDFPDFPGCVTAGSTLDEARVMAAEALGGHIACLVESGHDIPESSTLDAVMADSANRDALPFLVTVDEPRARAVRVNITMPDDVLKQIDEYARAHGMSRSRFLARAAEQAMAAERKRAPAG